MKLSVPIFRLKREAKLLSRKTGIPLHAALDQMAASEGFKSWSLLAASHTLKRPTSAILAEVTPSDMVLLGARPGHGKTLLALDMMVEAVKAGGTCFFFSLDFTEAEILHHISALGADVEAFRERIDTSDAISADYIIRHLGSVETGTIIIIDYLQILDQRRKNAELSLQVAALKAFAQKTGAILVFISQIDRFYDPSTKPLPDLVDVRMPNPVDLRAFTKTCFLHDGEGRFEAVA